MQHHVHVCCLHFKASAASQTHEMLPDYSFQQHCLLTLQCIDTHCQRFVNDMVHDVAGQAVRCTCCTLAMRSIELLPLWTEVCMIQSQHCVDAVGFPRCKL